MKKSFQVLDLVCQILDLVHQVLGLGLSLASCGVDSKVCQAVKKPRYPIKHRYITYHEACLKQLCFDSICWQWCTPEHFKDNSRNVSLTYAFSRPNQSKANSCKCYANLKNQKKDTAVKLGETVVTYYKQYILELW